MNAGMLATGSAFSVLSGTDALEVLSVVRIRAYPTLEGDDYERAVAAHAALAQLVEAAIALKAEGWLDADPTNTPELYLAKANTLHAIDLVGGVA